MSSVLASVHFWSRQVVSHIQVPDPEELDFSVQSV